MQCSPLCCADKLRDLRSGHLAKRGIIGKFTRYFMTAGAAAAIDFGGFVVLQHLQVPVVPAAAASFGLAALVNYGLTSRYVFGRKLSLRTFFIFLAGALAGFCVNVSVTALGALVLGIWPAAAKLFGIGTAFLVNFLINLRIVFR